MAVFFTGAFMRELRRETERRIRRDFIEHTPRHLAHLTVGHPLSARRLFSGLGTRRLFSARGKLGPLSEPRSQATGTPRNQYSTSGNQSRSSVGRGRHSQTGPTRGTSGTRGSSSTTGTGRTSGTSGTRPTNFQRSGASNRSRRSRSRTSRPAERRRANNTVRRQNGSAQVGQ